MAVAPTETQPAASAPNRARRRPLRLDRVSLLLVFVGVPFAVYALLVLYPFAQAAWYSLTSWTGFNPRKPFVGFKNYLTLAEDQLFLQALGNTVVLLVILPALTILVSFILAILITIGGRTDGQVRGVWGASVYRVVGFFPYVVPSVVIGIIWAQVYDPTNGLLNGVLTGVGLKQFELFAWLGLESTAMGATIAVIVWAFAGFYMVLFIAAIRSLPTEMFEAARLDGAGRFRTAVSIVAPAVMGTVRASYIYMGIIALDMFVFMRVFNPDGGPRNSTYVITQLIYDTAFTGNKWGLACAMGVVLAVLTFAFIGLVSLIRYLIARSTR